MSYSIPKYTANKAEKIEAIILEYLKNCQVEDRVTLTYTRLGIKDIFKATPIVEARQSLVKKGFIKLIGTDPVTSANLYEITRVPNSLF